LKTQGENKKENKNHPKSGLGRKCRATSGTPTINTMPLPRPIQLPSRWKVNHYKAANSVFLNSLGKLNQARIGVWLKRKYPLPLPRKCEISPIFAVENFRILAQENFRLK
jgi:hypothetical protein